MTMVGGAAVSPAMRYSSFASPMVRKPEGERDDIEYLFSKHSACAPSPACGGGRGGGSHTHGASGAPSPALPRKRGRGRCRRAFLTPFLFLLRVHLAQLE